MDYYLVFGMVAVCFGAMLTFSRAIEKKSEEDRKPINDLNVNIAKLTASIDNMKERDLTRDKRLDDHGKEIDHLKGDVIKHNEALKNHHERIAVLEEREREH